MKKVKFPYIYMGTILFLMYIPLAVTLVSSFNLSRTSALWTGFSLHWYTELFKDTALMDALLNSTILAFGACILSAVIGTMAAVGIHRSQTKWNLTVESMSMLPIMIPEIILGMALLAVFTMLKLPFGMLTLILAHTTFCVPYVYMSVKSRLEQMTPNIVQAARDLGANPFHLFFDIILPQLIPGILSGMLLAFAMSFDDVIISLFVTGTTVNTLPIQIYTRVKTGITPEINALIALTLLLLLVAVSVYLTIQSFSRRKTLQNAP